MPAMLLSLHAFSCFRYGKAPAAVGRGRQGGMERLLARHGAFQAHHRWFPGEFEGLAEVRQGG